MSDPAATRHAWAEQANASAKDEHGKLYYEGAVAFGGETLHRWRLGNGLAVLVLVDASAPVVAYYTWFNVGSRHERPGKTGLAHLFEHLMFGETEKLKAGVFDRKLEESGAETNAATWVDWTYYHELLPADRVRLAVTPRGRADAAPRPARAAGREREGGRRQRAALPRRRRRRGGRQRAALQDGLHEPPLPLADHRVDGGHQGLHARGLRRLLPDVLRAEQRDGRRRGRRARAHAPALRSATRTGSSRASRSRPRTSIPEPPQVDERRLELRKPTASEKLLVAFKGPALGDADHATLTRPQRGALRRPRVAPLPRARRRAGARDRRARLGVDLPRPGSLRVLGHGARGAHGPRDPARARRGLRARPRRRRGRRRARPRQGAPRARLAPAARDRRRARPSRSASSRPSSASPRTRSAASRPTGASTASDLRRVARRYLVDSARTVLRVAPESQPAAAAGPATPAP